MRYVVVLLVMFGYGAMVALGQLLGWYYILWPEDPKQRLVGILTAGLSVGMSLWFLWRYYVAWREDRQIKEA